MENKYYLLCASPRSGTNIFRHFLRQYQFGVPSEIATSDMEFNDIPKQYLDENALWLNNFLRSHHHRPANKEHVLYSRCIWSFQFYDVINRLRDMENISKDIPDAEVLDTIYPNIQYIYLYRSNVVKQAISLEKARQCDQWLTINEKLDDYEVDPDLKYNFGVIAQEVIFRMDAQILWDDIFEVMNIAPLRVRYEDLMHDIEMHLSRVADFLGVDSSRISNECTQQILSHKDAPVRQSDEVNKEWAGMYYRDLERIKEL